MVGHAQSLTELARLRRHQHRAVRATDGEAFAFLRQCCRSTFCKIVRLAVLDAGQHAELVAAESVGATLAVDRRAEPARDASEQRVARGVAERVVVRLESVQVEDDERERRAFVRQRSIELEHEAPTVAEPGQRIGQRLLAASG